MGDDALGRWLRDAFPATSPAWACASAPTTVTVGLIHSGGERTFFSNSGHLAGFSPEQVLDQLPARAARGDIVLLCGVFLSPLLVAGGLALCERLAQRGYALALDTGWPDRGWESVRATVVSWLPFMAHVLLNELEVLALSDMPDVDRAATWFLAHLRPGANLVVKCGRDGARAWCGTRRTHCAAPSVNVIDTVGAGDVFNAGYLLGIASNLSLEDSLRYGVAVAGAAISTSPRSYGIRLTKALRPGA